MTIDDYHTTLSNKLNGTLHLHSVARQLGLNLEFFTMLASISGVVGQKGQANYAAANVFMDAFAGYRQSMGLPANSVDLGVIEDVGYVAEQGGMEQHFDDRQWTGINEHVLRNILGYSILEQSDAFNPAIHTQLITGIPVPQPEDSGLKADARFSALFIPQDAEAAGPSSSAGGDAGKEIKSFFMMLKAGADAAALQTTCVNIVNKQFTKTLRLSEPMEPAKALTAYGLDSLAAVEFRNWVRNELGTELTTLEINNSPSLFALCEKIVARSKG